MITCEERIEFLKIVAEGFLDREPQHQRNLDFVNSVKDKFWLWRMLMRDTRMKILLAGRIVPPCIDFSRNEYDEARDWLDKKAWERTI